MLLLNLIFWFCVNKNSGGRPLTWFTTKIVVKCDFVTFLVFTLNHVHRMENLKVKKEGVNRHATNTDIEIVSKALKEPGENSEKEFLLQQKPLMKLSKTETEVCQNRVSFCVSKRVSFKAKKSRFFDRFLPPCASIVLAACL